MAQHLSRKLIPLSTGIALLVAVLAPVTFWIHAHRELRRTVTLYAEDLADQFRQVGLESPALWKNQTSKFNTITEGFHPTVEVSGFRVLDEKGKLISGHDYQKIRWEKMKINLSLAEVLYFTKGTASIMINDRRVGTVEVLADDTPIVRTSALLFIFWSLVGIALAALVYRFPVKVVRKMEGNIRENEARYSGIFEYADDIIYLLNPDSTFRSLNPAFEQITGWTAEEWIGKPFAPIVHPDDLPHANDIFRKTLAGESLPSFGLRLARKSGEYFDADLSITPLGHDVVTSAVGIARDVTTRKRAEEALRSATEFSRIVMDSIDDAISIIDVSDYLITGCNAVFLKQVGLAEAEVVGKKCYELTHHRTEPCCPPLDTCPMKETVTTGNHAIAEHIHFLANGDKFYSEVSSSPIFDGDGKVVRVVHVSHDVTERKRAEDKILRLNEELETKVEERTSQLLEVQEELVRKEKLSILGQLSGSVGHELRNPLGVMSNALYFLKMVLAEADETVKEYLDIIRREIDNSLRIITDLLDFARTKAPRITVMTVRELTDKSLGRCSIPEKVDLQIEIPDDLFLLRVDPLQMEQVLQNLIMNAVQAMPDGGTLRIAARPARAIHESPRQNSTHEPADFVEIIVTDTGEGISSENMKKLFQPLFTTKAKGIGLGLVVCRNLVENNGGRIEVESEPGKGTTFTMVLPVEKGKI
jgi:PAS domain S-box-containing protein